MVQAIVPPFTLESAEAKVQIAQDLWNTRNPERVALACTEDCEWRNRVEFLTGREQIKAFLRRKWDKSLITASRRHFGVFERIAWPSTLSTNGMTILVDGIGSMGSNSGSSSLAGLCAAG